MNELRDAMEACRPGSEDLAAPEMDRLRERLADDAELRAAYERTQRSDAALAQSFHDVAVPAGLEQRLLAALAAAELAPTPEVIDARSEPPRPVALPTRRTRRMWMVGAATVAACVMLAIFLGRPTGTLTHDQLARDAQAWTERLVEQHDAGRWQPFDEQRFPTLDWHSARWQTIRTPLDRRAVVFDFPLRGNQRLLVYRIQTTRNLGLPALPYQALTTTGKWRVAAWQESEFVYVAVTNRPELFEGFRSGPGPA